MSNYQKIVLFVFPLLLYFIVEHLYGFVWAAAISALIPIFFILRSIITGKGAIVHHLADLAFIGIFALFELLPCSLAIVFGLLSLLMILSALGKIDMFKLFDLPVATFQNNPYVVYNMRKSQLRMGIWFLVGAIFFLLAYINKGSFLSDWIDKWGMITIVLLCVATEIIAGRINYYRYRNVEFVPLVDETGKVLGQCPRPLVHNGSLWLHPVVHLHVVNKGRLLLQLRPKHKKIQPGKWDTAVGGHISAGEDIQKALGREVWEEIGLTNFKAKLMKSYLWQSSVEREYVFSFMTEASGPFETKNVGEVEQLRFWTKEELTENIGKEVFTPNLEQELKEWILPNI